MPQYTKMNFKEKLSKIQDNHFSEWLKTRQQVLSEMSEKQLMFCICGKLATGLHERHCRKLANAVTKETVKRLKYLLKRKCEAKYGDNECQNEATKTVISCGRLFELCKPCAKLSAIQEALNHQ